MNRLLTRKKNTFSQRRNQKYVSLTSIEKLNTNTTKSSNRKRNEFSILIYHAAFAAA